MSDLLGRLHAVGAADLVAGDLDTGDVHTGDPHTGDPDDAHGSVGADRAGAEIRRVAVPAGPCLVVDRRSVGGGPPLEMVVFPPGTADAFALVVTTTDPARDHRELGDVASGIARSLRIRVGPDVGSDVTSDDGDGPSRAPIGPIGPHRSERARFPGEGPATLLAAVVLVVHLVAGGRIDSGPSAVLLWTLVALLWLGMLSVWTRRAVALACVSLSSAASVVIGHLVRPDRIGTAVTAVAIVGAVLAAIGLRWRSADARAD